MIKKFNQFILESKDSKYLLYYAFDWDDNILNMPTVIHMEKKEGDSWVPVDVSTAEFAIVRNDKDNYRTTEDSFCEFRDSGPRGEDAFLIDVKKAISQKRFGPAWSDFIECLIHGSVFAIITARGHESPAMRKGIEWIIDNILTEEQQNQMYNYLLKYAYIFKKDDGYDRILRGRPSQNKLFKIYLDNCDLIGVSSPSRGGSPADPEKSKEEALMIFNSKINNFAASVGMKAKIGFSDDDLRNVKHVEELIQNINHEKFPHIIQYIVKGTKYPSDITKKIRNVFIESSNQSIGMESSVLKFTQFGNMTGHLYPQGPDNRQDDYNNQIKRQTKYLAKTSKEILGNSKKRNKKPSK